MSEFFRFLFRFIRGLNRRQRMGFVTLFAAIVLFGFWMGSLDRRWTVDIRLPGTQRYQWIAFSCDSHFMIYEMRDLNDGGDTSGNIETDTALHYVRNLLSGRYDATKSIIGTRFAYMYERLAHFRFRGIIFPCWALVIPLTILSGYLLSSNPRTTKTQNQTDST